jgi:hypothetical protein
MMRVLLFLLLSACAQTGEKRVGQIANNNARVYLYRDESGDFEISREVKFVKGRLATRVQILTSAGGSEKLLEKSFAVSSVGSVKSRSGRSMAVRPELSQHTVWLDGKKYFSQLKLNTRSKSLEAITETPDSQGQKAKSARLPRGRIFCFYSQLPECLVLSGLLDVASSAGRRGSFIMVWDSWPFHQEHFSGLGPAAFAGANVTAEEISGAEKRYTVDVAGQSISLHFSENNTFLRLFWTAQGISVLPPSERSDNP